MLNEWLSSLWSRLRTLGARRRLDRDLEDELEFHLAMRRQKLNDAGLETAEAGYSARRSLGNVALLKERTRSLWTFPWLEQLAQDVRFASRSIKKSPVIATVVILSLALGIGANTAIFSLIDAVMLRMLPVHDPQELVLLERTWPGSPPHGGFTNVLWESLRDRQDVFSGIFAFGSDLFDLSRGGAVRYADGIFVSGAYFSTLSIQPAAGRLLTNADDHRGCPAVAVLSYGFWQSHFGGAQNALGSTISLDQQPFSIVGVSARGFSGLEVGRKFDVALPICAAAVFASRRDELENRSAWGFDVIGRPKDAMSLEQVNARLAVLSPSVAAPALPQDWDDKSQKNFLRARLLAVPAPTGISPVRDRFAGPLNILMAIVGVVLLIACANIASLLLARSATRSRELAIRKALGASRNRLVRQLMTETLLLSSAGALTGLLAAHWGSALLVRELATARGTMALDLSLDGRVLAFTALAAVSTGVLMGVLPALRSTRGSLNWALKGGQGPEQLQRGRFRAGKSIVAMQIALSLVLLIGGGLLVRSFVKLLRVDLGFDPRHVLMVFADLNTARIPAEKQEAICHEVESRLRALPGVVSASHSFTTPLGGIRLLTWIRPPEGDRAFIHFNFVAPGYFNTMRTALLEGRDFNSADTSTSPQVAIVNEIIARKLFPGTDALGKIFHLDFPPSRRAEPIEIVGVVQDSKYDSARQETPPTAFFPITQLIEHRGFPKFEVRTATEPAALEPSVQQSFAGVDKEIPLEFRTLEQQSDDSLLQERILAELSAFFAGLALLLAMVGLYGALSYFVTQRQREFGIRMALGAPRGSVLRLVLKDVIIVLTAGLAAGVAISFVVVNLLKAMLYELQAHDPVTLAIAIASMSAIGLMAGAIPARRATRVDPLVALRYE